MKSTVVWMWNMDLDRDWTEAFEVQVWRRMWKIKLLWMSSNDILRTVNRALLNTIQKRWGHWKEHTTRGKGILIIS